MAIVILLLLQSIIALPPYEVIGQCMEPSFEGGQRLLVNKAVYHFHEPERGDVIILDPPFEHSEPFIKRIIGLPGDTIEIKGGMVYINGSKLDEPYIKEPVNYTVRQKEIPADEYFVLGDNRNNAYDSHKWGTLERQNIIGKVWLTIWPPDKWGLAPHYSFSNN